MKIHCFYVAMSFDIYLENMHTFTNEMSTTIEFIKMQANLMTLQNERNFIHFIFIIFLWSLVNLCDFT